MGIILYGAVLCAAAVPAAADTVERYASGLMRAYSAEQGPTETESRAFARFLETHAVLDAGMQWRLERETRDATHVHRLYALTYYGRRVVDQYLLAHYNRNGWVEYASSTWRLPLGEVSLQSEGRGEAVALSIARDFSDRFGVALPKTTHEPVVWIDERTGKALGAFRVEMDVPSLHMHRELVVDEDSGRILEERRPERHLTDLTNRKVYTPSPKVGDPPTIATLRTNGTLYDLDATTELSGPFLNVKRSLPDRTLVKIDPNTDFTAATGAGQFDNFDNNNPANYKPDCNLTGTDKCPNQGFEGVNVYHHLSSFRRQLMGYLSTLGVTKIGSTTCNNPPCFPGDPLLVVVNQPSLSSGSSSFEANNAAYLGRCTVLGATHCLVFFRPEAINGTSCGGTASTKVFSLAREASVVVHEFQHYVTDSITAIAFSSSSALNVGDALHEGYSDYFGASYTETAAAAATPAPSTEEAAVARTLLGYSFQNCPGVTRSVTPTRPYRITAANNAHYDVGQTWASGLWKLREDLGTTTGDLLALKSLFFLSPKPNYIEAVEALVKADQSINQGVNVSKIRRLFYTELGFLGGQSGAFRDSANLVAEVGFQSCAGVGVASRGVHAGYSLAALAAWLIASLAVGRYASRRGK